MQRSRILSLREKIKDNILYQAEYSEEFTLEEILGINESEALNTLPKWILICHRNNLSCFLINWKLTFLRAAPKADKLWQNSP